MHGDKAYRRQERSAALKQRGIKNGLQYHASTGHPLTQRQVQFNRGVSRKRYNVERTFGGMKCLGCMSQVYRNKKAWADDRLAHLPVSLWNVHLRQAAL